ncbi:jg13880 [Pararge aegeria aegeria]|uniref:Jg13880 protein n=1 Tax=Pararge aegeria aegeria TaxID=348720 RepID=A0A8S4S4L7_9NEOP|nr:jg13880 [Pararge aegeria aegeria]
MPPVPFLHWPRISKKGPKISPPPHLHTPAASDLPSTPTDPPPGTINPLDPSSALSAAERKDGRRYPNHRSNHSQSTNNIPKCLKLKIYLNQKLQMTDSTY